MMASCLPSACLSSLLVSLLTKVNELHFRFFAWVVSVENDGVSAILLLRHVHISSRTIHCLFFLPQHTCQVPRKKERVRNCLLEGQQITGREAVRGEESQLFWLVFKPFPLTLTRLPMPSSLPSPLPEHADTMNLLSATEKRVSEKQSFRRTTSNTRRPKRSSWRGTCLVCFVLLCVFFVYWTKDLSHAGLNLTHRYCIHKYSYNSNDLEG